MKYLFIFLMILTNSENVSLKIFEEVILYLIEKEI